jgi:hypothetical protein
MDTNNENIQLFRSLFKGREDVFAVRWEKGNKSGYMPAYFYDPYRFRMHKMNGGSFQNFTEKSYLKLTDEQIHKHLTNNILPTLHMPIKYESILSNTFFDIQNKILTFDKI